MRGTAGVRATPTSAGMAQQACAALGRGGPASPADTSQHYSTHYTGHVRTLHMVLERFVAQAAAIKARGAAQSCA